MPNSAFEKARKLLARYKAAEGLSARAPLKPEHVTMVGMDLAKMGIHDSVMDNIFHDFQRLLYKGKSEIEETGAAWRHRHGFGRPFSTGNAPGSGRGYRYGESRRDAERRAVVRREQKSSRVRTRVANGARKAAAAVKRVLFRGASRGA